MSSSSLNRVSEWGLMSWVEWIVMHNITNCVEFEIRHDSLKIFYTRSEKFNKRKAHASNTYFVFIFAHKPPGLITVRESPSGEI